MSKIKRISVKQMKKDIQGYNLQTGSKHSAAFWYVSAVATHPDFTRQGYGKKLMSACDIVAGQSLQYLECAVGREGFYEKCDYVHIFPKDSAENGKYGKFWDPKHPEYGSVSGYVMYRNMPGKGNK